jgi:iron complex outermembrane receptor protein
MSAIHAARDYNKKFIRRGRVSALTNLSTTRGFKASFAATMLVSTMLHAPAVAAQTTGPDQVANAMDDIIVTARRREESLQSVPVAITAVSGQMLADFRIDSVDSLERLEPSLSVSPASGRPNSPVYALRGVRPTESIYGQDPTVAVYLADVVQSPAQGSNLGFYDLENVQVLKGPQGTLFGRNTVAGAILLTPRKPGKEFAGNAMIGMGSYGLVEGEFGLDIPLAETFQIRLAGRAVEGGDYQRNVVTGYEGPAGSTPGTWIEDPSNINPLNGTRLGGQGIRSIRATLAGQFTPDISNTLIISYDENDNNGRSMILEAVNPDIPNYDPKVPDAPNLWPQRLLDLLERQKGRSVHDIESALRQRDRVQAWSLTNTFEARLSDSVQAKLIAAYREVETDVVTDIQVSATTSEQKNSLQHMSVEAQLLGDAFDGRLNWVTGLYYYSESGLEDSPGDFYGKWILQQGAIDNQSYSAFAQGSFKLTPDLTLTVGGRYTRDDKKMDLRQTVSVGPYTQCMLQVDNGGSLGFLPIDACQVNLTDSFSKPTGTISLDYKVSPDVLLYAASRYGYRSGGFNLRASQPVQYEAFRPETVTDFELGTKADWNIGDVKMRTNLAAFYQKYSDIQRMQSIVGGSGQPTTTVINAASANVFGIEFEQTIRPTRGLMLRLNYAYTDPSYKKWMDPVTNVDLTETPFFFTATHSGSGLVTYEKELPGDLGFLKFGVNASYMGGAWINAADTIVSIRNTPPELRKYLRQEDYWVVDLNAGWENISGSNVDFNFYVKNLTNTVYRVGGVQLYNGATGLITSAYAAPRTMGAQLRVKF